MRGRGCGVAMARVRWWCRFFAFATSRFRRRIFALSLLRRRAFALSPSRLRALAPRPGGEGARVEVAPSEHHSSWGIECRNNCSFGFYGFGCRKSCNCSNRQACDPKQGCIGSFKDNKKHENTITSTEPSSRTPNPDLDDITTLEAYLLLASGLLILLLLCTIFICYRKMKKQSKPIQTYADGQEDIYDDIRGSRMVDNNSDPLTRVCNLPPNLNGVITSVEKDKMSEEPSNQARIPLPRSRTLGPGGYGHWCRGSDNYNRVDFNSVKPLYSYSNTMTNDYDVFKSPKTSSETQLNDKECDGNKQFEEDIFGNNHRGIVHPIRKNRSMVNRPYSSVKYNRKTRMNEEH